MTIKEIIQNISLCSDENLVFAKKINGKFLPHSETVLVEIIDEERELKTHEIAAIKCPGFQYFLETFIIKDIITDLENSNEIIDLDRGIEIIINYAENDA